jgi:dihydroorotate dehydrogenase|tara:strand:+ start:85 stop:798 length:714 start_codon:yes stop_codon:yes gene_type:complete
MIFVSPPFGNYVKMDNVVSIKGSFTLEPRGGLYTQILKTLRYSFEYGGWVNKIGLRNKGIDWAIEDFKKNKSCVYSIALFNETEIDKIVNKIPKEMNIEINVSCPNVEKSVVNEGLYKFLNEERRWCIVKLSPKTSYTLIDSYYHQGFRQFHCCNTVPISRGGLSGRSIQPYSFAMANYIKTKYPDSEVIGGGGIQTSEDVEKYKANGCSHFSVSTLLFHPYKFVKFYLNHIHKQDK